MFKRKDTHVGRHWLPTVEVSGARPRVIRRAALLVTLGALGAAGALAITAPRAHATPSVGCETIRCEVSR